MSDDLRNRVGEAALKGLLDRRGLRELLQEIERDDPEVWSEIVAETADAALAEMGEPAPSAREAAQLLLDEWRHGEGPLGELYCYSLGEDGTMQPDIDGRWVELTKIEAALFRAIAEGKDDD